MESSDPPAIVDHIYCHFVYDISSWFGTSVMAEAIASAKATRVWVDQNAEGFRMDTFTDVTANRQKNMTYYYTHGELTMMTPGSFIWKNSLDPSSVPVKESLEQSESGQVDYILR